jgi:16S rRNA (cytosine967-C5)-methyltransferase
MRNEGVIVAHDNEASRLKLVSENCARLGVTIVEPTSSSPISHLPSPVFDRILVDAPCSNTGVVRRRVELRWRVQPAEIDRLRQLQLDLLRRAAPLLKPGGTLVYSTCALEPEENEGVVQNFLAGEKQFRLDHARQLLPFVDSVDGAYVAKLRRE